MALEFTGLLPIASDLDGSKSGQIFVQHDRVLLINKINYDHQFLGKTRLFLQLSVWSSLNREFESNRNFTSTPLSVFYSIYPNDKWTFYGMVELWPTWGGDFSYFFQPGFGVKYQLIRGLLEMESLITHFLAGQNEGAGSSFNLGLRIIR